MYFQPQNILRKYVRGHYARKFQLTRWLFNSIKGPWIFYPVNNLQTVNCLSFNWWPGGLFAYFIIERKIQRFASLLVWLATGGRRVLPVGVALEYCSVRIRENRNYLQFENKAAVTKFRENETNLPEMSRMSHTIKEIYHLNGQVSCIYMYIHVNIQYIIYVLL